MKKIPKPPSAHAHNYYEFYFFLKHLAQQFFVSKYHIDHIAHVFKDNMGLSVHQFITKKRLSLCRDAILAQGNIDDIYLMYGFKDYSSFFRAIKKDFGMSPKEYRELFSQQAQGVRILFTSLEKRISTPPRRAPLPY